MQKNGTIMLETERLLLRRFTPEDTEYMYRNWASDPEVTRFLTWPCHSSPDISRKILEQWVVQYEDGGFFNWGIELKSIGRVIGSLAVVKLDEDMDAAEIGYCLSRCYWGRGLMPEALIAAMRYLFYTVGINRISACHDVKNPQSGRVMEKGGLRYEGTLRQAAKNNRGICDVVMRAALKTDWQPEE